jgi:ABC-type transporter MlaC component
MSNNNNRTPHETILYAYTQLQDSLSTNSADDANILDENTLHLVRNLFDTERLVPQVLQNHWVDATKVEQTRLVEAFTVSLQQKILSQIEKFKGQKSLPTLTLTSEEVKDRVATLEYTVSDGKRKSKFTVFMIRYPEKNWKISNIRYGDESIVRHYYSICKNVMDKFSLSTLVAELSAADHVVLEDFESSELGGLPQGWTWRNQDDNKNKPYEIRIEDGNKFLAAEDQGESVILGKDVKWDLHKYPYISFKWRVHEIPEGADERYGRSVDSAAGIYVIYAKKLGLIPETVKYVWSSTLPVGSAMRRSGTGRPWMVVAESGDQKLGEWHTFVFNAYEAYQKTFGGKPPEVPIAIGLLSDANSTHSKAFADYDDIIALKSANAGSGVKEFLKAE